MFRTLICSDELNNDLMIREKLQRWEKSGLQLVFASEVGTVLLSRVTKEPSLLQEALWIVSTQEEWAKAQELGIAALPYVPDYEQGGMATFPTAEYIFTGFDDIDLEYLERMYRRAKHMPWIIAKTDDFVLREFAMSDMDALFELYEDETLYPFVEPLFEREREEEYEIQYISNMYQLLGFGMWLVCEPDTGRVIGRAGIEPHEYGDETGIELGYLLHRDYRGKGLAKKVCEAIIDYVKNELEYKEINCVIHKTNTASIQFAKRLGFTLCDNQSGVSEDMSRYCKKVR